jgi:hypothetical protein
MNEKKQPSITFIGDEKSPRTFVPYDTVANTVSASEGKYSITKNNLSQTKDVKETDLIIVEESIATQVVVELTAAGLSIPLLVITAKDIAFNSSADTKNNLAEQLNLRPGDAIYNYYSIAVLGLGSIIDSFFQQSAVA